MNLFRGHFNSNGTEIAYYRTGGDLPPVVLVHGLTDSGMCWSSLIAELALSYDTVFLDNRGHGYTGLAADGVYTVAAMREDIRTLIESLELDRPTLIGHSMGAAVSASFAAMYPELIRGVILVDPPWIAEELVTPEKIREGFESFRSDLSEFKALSFADLVSVGKERNPNWVEEDYRAWAKAKQMATFEVLEILPDLLTDWRKNAEKIHIPAMLMTGNPDLGAIVTPEIAAQVCSGKPNWTLFYSATAKHGVTRDDRENSTRAIKRFLLDRSIDLAG